MTPSPHSTPGLDARGGNEGAKYVGHYVVLQMTSAAGRAQRARMTNVPGNSPDLEADWQVLAVGNAPAGLAVRWTR